MLREAGRLPTFPSMAPHTATFAQVGLAADARGFVRRCCPQCRRHFKVGAAHAEELLVHAMLTRLVAHANAEEVPQPPRRFCPYCGHGAGGDVFLTPAQREYLEGWARALRRDVRYEQLRQVESQHTHALTFRTVAPAPVVLVQPPEPDDMQAAPLLCCGEEVKLKASWRESFFCHHCRARHRGDE